MTAPWNTAWITGTSTGIGRELALQRPGMLLDVTRAIDIAMAHNFMVGDFASVLTAGAAAGDMTILGVLGYTQPKHHPMIRSIG